MSGPSWGDPLAELRAALGEGDSDTPPVGLGARILRSALVARSPGRPLGAVSPADPREAFSRAAESLDALLGALRPREWSQPALRALDVQGLVGHLIGVERAFAAVVADPDSPHARADHVSSTDPVAIAQAGRAPSDTLEEWRSAVADTLVAVERTPAADGPELGLHGVRLPLGPLLTVRTFELWTHEEDVRRATGRPLAPPDDTTLSLMVDLAIVLVTATLQRRAAAGARTSRRLVLTGPAGGTWSIPARSADAREHPPDDVVVVMDTVSFCRLVANRHDPSDVPATVAGDGEAARALFAAAASLALD